MTETLTCFDYKEQEVRWNRGEESEETTKTGRGQIYICPQATGKDRTVEMPK